jgi:hypothetical protein
MNLGLARRFGALSAFSAFSAFFVFSQTPVYFIAHSRQGRMF